MKNYIIDNISIRGFSHIQANKECQDNSLSWQTDSYAAVIVCDGHGGEKYIRSADGSAIACEMGKRAIDEFMQHVYSKKTFSNNYVSDLNSNNSDKLLSQLERSIIHCWNEEVINNYTEIPLNTDERWEALSDSDKKSLERNSVKAYGTTFIASVITKDFCFVIKLGDGNANLILNDKTISSPEELADDMLQFNITTSMCNSDADIMFRHYFCNISSENENSVVGVLLSSDGVINCFRSEEAYYSFVENVYYAYGEESVENARNELEGALNVFSERGSGDDLSIAIIRGEMTDEEKQQLKAKREQEEIEREKRQIEKEKAEAEQLRLEAEKAKAAAEREKEETEKIKQETEKAKAELEAEKEKFKKEKFTFESEKYALEKDKRNKSVIPIAVIKETSVKPTDTDTISKFISNATKEAKTLLKQATQFAEDAFSNNGDKYD